MVRRVLSLALALQLLLPAHAMQVLLAAAVAAPAPKAAPKVCPCCAGTTCRKCCQRCGEAPETEAAPGKPDANPGPHGSFQCHCKIAESLATSSVYVPNRSPMLQTLCQPQQEWLSVRAERWLSPVLPIDSPPPKDQA